MAVGWAVFSGLVWFYFWFGYIWCGGCAIRKIKRISFFIKAWQCNILLYAIQKIEPMLVNKICEDLTERIVSGELSNDNLVQIIEHISGYLNLQTISAYSKANNISYNGAKKFRQVREIAGVKFVIDND